MNLSESDFANRELSIEELEAIAGGNWLGHAIHWVGHEIERGWDAVKSPDGQAVIGIAGLVLGVIGLGGGGNPNGSGTTLKQN